MVRLLWYSFTGRLGRRDPTLAQPIRHRRALARRGYLPGARGETNVRTVFDLYQRAGPLRRLLSNAHSATVALTPRLCFPPLNCMVGRRTPQSQRRGAICEVPDAECPGNLGRTVAEKTFPGRRLASVVVSNRDLDGERIVITVERGRLTGDTPDETRVRHRIWRSLHGLHGPPRGQSKHGISQS